MSDYTKTTNFTAKDSLPVGNAAKKILGSLFDTEFDNIATAVATKADLTSATLVTPDLGTPSAGTLTNCTGLPVSGLASVTATAAELNILDGVTATAAELNILDGVTSTAAELNLVDGSSAGTIVNSKGVIYGAAGEVNATTLEIAGTAITATAAELNVLDGIPAGLTSTELGYCDGVTSSIQTQLDSIAVGSLQYLTESIATSSVAEVDITLTGGYDSYLIIVEGWSPISSNANMDIFFSTDAGSTFAVTMNGTVIMEDDGGSTATQTSATAVSVGDSLSGSAAYGWSGRIWLSNVQQDDTIYMTCMFEGGSLENTSNDYVHSRGYFISQAALGTDIDAIRFKASGQNTTEGKFAVYGIGRS